MTTTITELERILNATPPGHAVCPPLQRGLMVRIAAELREKHELEQRLADVEALAAQLQWQQTMISAGE